MVDRNSILPVVHLSTPSAHDAPYLLPPVDAIFPLIGRRCSRGWARNLPPMWHADKAYDSAVPR